MKFQPGQSGNPGGRARGLERRVRDLLGDDIDEMTKAMRDIALGKTPTEGPLKDSKITTRDRIEAYKVLTDRGWGKPRAVVDLTGNVTVGQQIVDYSQLTDEQLDKIIEAERIAESVALPVGEPNPDESDLDGDPSSS